jgi:hypothetical protein
MPLCPSGHSYLPPGGGAHRKMESPPASIVTTFNPFNVPCVRKSNYFCVLIAEDMNKQAKRIERIRQIPSDCTLREMIALLSRRSAPERYLMSSCRPYPTQLPEPKGLVSAGS